MNNKTKFYPILDDFGTVRALSFSYKGETFTAQKQGVEVTRAVSEVLGEEVQDWSKAPVAAAQAEIHRRREHQSDRTTTGLYTINDKSGRVLAVVNVLEGDEDECKQIATQVAVRLSAFYKQKLKAVLVADMARMIGSFQCLPQIR